MVYICTGFPRPQLWAIRADGKGDVTDSHVAWRVTRRIPKKPSPLLVGDELYVISDNGVASCLDARTGTANWMERISGNYSASPVHADGKVYFFSHEGKTTVVKADSEFKPLGENHLEGSIMASPAFLADAIVLRTDTHLYRIQKR
jgi:hypothetical protein